MKVIVGGSVESVDLAIRRYVDLFGRSKIEKLPVMESRILDELKEYNQKLESIKLENRKSSISSSKGNNQKQETSKIEEIEDNQKIETVKTERRMSIAERMKAGEDDPNDFWYNPTHEDLSLKPEDVKIMDGMLAFRDRLVKMSDSTPLDFSDMICVGGSNNPEKGRSDVKEIEDTEDEMGMGSNWDDDIDENETSGTVEDDKGDFPGWSDDDATNEEADEDDPDDGWGDWGSDDDSDEKGSEEDAVSNENENGVGDETEDGDDLDDGWGSDDSEDMGENTGEGENKGEETETKEDEAEETETAEEDDFGDWGDSGDEEDDSGDWGDSGDEESKEEETEEGDFGDWGDSGDEEVEESETNSEDRGTEVTNDGYTQDDWDLDCWSKEDDDSNTTEVRVEKSENAIKRDLKKVFEISLKDDKKKEKKVVRKDIGSVDDDFWSDENDLNNKKEKLPDKVAVREKESTKESPVSYDTSSLRGFVKSHKGCKCTIEEALQYFKKGDIEKDLRMGRVFKGKKSLFI